MGVHAVTEISLYWSVKHFLFKKISSSLHNVFSLFVLSLFKEMFSWPRSGSQGCLTGQENIFLPSASLFLFPSTVYSKRCFPDQDLALRGVWRVKKISFYLQQVFFSFRPQSIQGDVFYDQEMVNRPQWITTSEADTDSRLSVPGWSRVLNGPSLTMEVNIYPKKCQYPGSETVWYKNVRQMDFYSPLIPSGGLKAEPMVNAAYEELFEARLGIATSNSMCLSLGKESCKSGRFFWWG